MKIIVEDSDKSLAESLMRDEGILDFIFLNKDSKKCSLELQITDPARCEIFLMQLYYALKNFTQEECGFRVSAITDMGVRSDMLKFRAEIEKLMNKYL